MIIPIIFLRWLQRNSAITKKSGVPFSFFRDTSTQDSTLLLITHIQDSTLLLITAFQPTLDIVELREIGIVVRNY